MKIGIVIGSVRDKRLGESVGKWVYEATKGRTDAQFELIDLKSFNIPVLTSPTHPMQADKQYDDAGVQRWSAAIDACDGYVFVTPEYNHGVPGGFKNAVDCLGNEWVGKTVGFVAYGSDGGVRATEQWRQIVANFSMFDIRSAVAMSIFTDVKDGEFAPQDRRADEVTAVLDDLVAATRRLQD